MMANYDISRRDPRRYGCTNRADLIDGNYAERPQQQPVKALRFAEELPSAIRPAVAYPSKKSFASLPGQQREVALPTPPKSRVLNLVPPLSRGNVVLPSPRNDQEKIHASIDAGPRPAEERAESLRQQLLYRAPEQRIERERAAAAQAAGKNDKPSGVARQSKDDSQQTTVSKLLHAIVPPGIRHWLMKRKMSTRSARRELTVKQASDSPRASNVAYE
jgi:hypothetical protein